MDLPGGEDLDIEGFKSRWILTPEQLASTNRSQDELEGMQGFLLSLEDAFRREIADWALEDACFLYQDEIEGDYILRMFSFSKGLTKCLIVINCFPQIELTNKDMDIELLMHISNIITAELVEVLVE